jgi:hypothetical protein
MNNQLKNYEFHWFIHKTTNQRDLKCEFENSTLKSNWITKLKHINWLKCLKAKSKSKHKTKQCLSLKSQVFTLKTNLKD